MVNRQYIYIDDSGDPGLPSFPGASRVLVLLGVGPHDDKFDIDLTETMDALRTKLRRKPMSEFKFHSTRPAVRADFYNAVAMHHPAVSAVMINKCSAKNQELLKNPDLLLNYGILSLLRQLQLASPAVVIIDGVKGKEYTKKTATYLRQNLPSGVIKSVIYRDSKKNNVLQLADMLVGLVADIYEDGRSTYAKELKRFNIDITEL